MESYIIFDFSILIIILISAIFAFSRGLAMEMLSLTGWILSFSGSYLFGGEFVNFANRFFNNLLISKFISHITIFIGLLIVFSFFTRKISSYIKSSLVSFIDRTLGFIFGIARGYLIASLSFLTFDYFYEGKKIEWIDKSKFVSIIEFSNTKLLNLMKIDNEYTRNLRNDIELKSNKLFEKSIDSKLKFNDLNNKEDIYDSKSKKQIENIIQNNME